MKRSSAATVAHLAATFLCIRGRYIRLHLLVVALAVGLGRLLKLLEPERRAPASCTNHTQQKAKTTPGASAIELGHGSATAQQLAVTAPRTAFSSPSMSFQRLATSRAMSGKARSGISATTVGRVYWENSRNADLPRLGLRGSFLRRRLSLGMVTRGGWVLCERQATAARSNATVRPLSARQALGTHGAARARGGVGQPTPVPATGPLQAHRTRLWA